MSVQVDPTLLSELHKYGAFDIDACFNCGNCTAICPLSTESVPLPRRAIRYIQVGARDKLLASLDPWLCYYCGECSQTCPRQAEPGEAMMSLRRYLTAQYDWTGLSSRLYLSRAWEIGSLIVVSAFTLVLVALFHGPLVSDRVELNTFAPLRVVHFTDMVLLVGLSFFLLSNAFRMYWFTMHRDIKVKVPLLLYVTELKTLVWHAVTQIRFSACENRSRWIKHWLVASGYALMFILVVIFLRWFQTDNIYPLYHPQRWLGYYAAIVLIYGMVEILIGRIRKQEQIHRFSHMSDWIFPVLLLLTAITGLLVHVFRYLGLPFLTYYTYVVHLAIVAPMLVVEVPFGKWAHLAYRPLAVYFQTVKEKALQQQRLEMAAAVPAA